MIWALLLAVIYGGVVVYRSHRFQQFSAAEGWKNFLSAEEKNTLRKHFDFYKMLPVRSQRIFEYRVFRFRKLTQFIPRDMDEVTAEMEILISASATQLAFGFDDVFLSHFEKILVYPDQFFSTSNQRYHKGEVNPRMGVIVLSWKHFVEGYTQNEGVNLGLHEMAHALQLENIIMNDEFGFMSDEDIADWRELAVAEMEKMRNGDTTFFREYGATNQAEFFAVAVENFFERPSEFSEYNSPLYNCLCHLLHQNPKLLLNR